MEETHASLFATDGRNHPFLVFLAIAGGGFIAIGVWTLFEHFRGG